MCVCACMYVCVLCMHKCIRDCEISIIEFRSRIRSIEIKPAVCYHR